MFTEDQAYDYTFKMVEFLATANGDQDNAEAPKYEHSAIVEENLSKAQKGLLNEIREEFDPENIDADRYILYEISNFKDDTHQGEDEFWANYEDFFELGYDERDSMIDKILKITKFVEEETGTEQEPDAAASPLGNNHTIQDANEVLLWR